MTEDAAQTHVAPFFLVLRAVAPQHARDPAAEGALMLDALLRTHAPHFRHVFVYSSVLGGCVESAAAVQDAAALDRWRLRHCGGGAGAPSNVSVLEGAGAYDRLLARVCDEEEEEEEEERRQEGAEPAGRASCVVSMDSTVVLGSRPTDIAAQLRRLWLAEADERLDATKPTWWLRLPDKAVRLQGLSVPISRASAITTAQLLRTYQLAHRPGAQGASGEAPAAASKASKATTGRERLPTWWPLALAMPALLALLLWDTVWSWHRRARRACLVVQAWAYAADVALIHVCSMGAVTDARTIPTHATTPPGRALLLEVAPDGTSRTHLFRQGARHPSSGSSAELWGRRDLFRHLGRSRTPLLAAGAPAPPPELHSPLAGVLDAQATTYLAGGAHGPTDDKIEAPTGAERAHAVLAADAASFDTQPSLSARMPLKYALRNYAAQLLGWVGPLFLMLVAFNLAVALPFGTLWRQLQPHAWDTAGERPNGIYGLVATCTVYPMLGLLALLYAKRSPLWLKTFYLHAERQAGASHYSALWRPIVSTIVALTLPIDIVYAVVDHIATIAHLWRSRRMAPS